MVSRAQLAVTGLGMATSLGLDAVMSCAAARAGMSGGKALERFPVQSPDDNSSGLLAGHALPEVTRGFEGAARLLRVVQAGLVDLFGTAGDRVNGDGRVGVYVAVPEPLRLFEGLAWLEAPEDRQARQQSLEDAAQQVQPEAAGRMIERAFALCAPAFRPSAVVVRPGSGATSLQLLDLAARELTDGAVDVAVVGGIDSLIDDDYLQWLATLRRLKTPGQPVGLQPGEGAAFVVVEGHRTLRAARPLALLGEVAIADEPSPWTAAASSTGRAVAEVVEQAQRGAPGAVPPSWMITDHNGETYRAAEWGSALVRLTARRRAQSDWTSWFPATSFGDTGAASALVGLGVAVRAFARSYHPAPSATVVATAPGATRAAVRVDAAGDR